MTYEILQDPDPINPYEEFDQIGTLYHWHRRGFVGTPYDQYEPQQGDLRFAVYLYEHSGQTISPHPFNCPWDSGQVGVWVVSKDEIVDNIEEIIHAQINELDAYITGQVWGYVTDDGDSCWGYFGDEGMKQAKEDANAITQRNIV